MTEPPCHRRWDRARVGPEEWSSRASAVRHSEFASLERRGRGPTIYEICFACIFSRYHRRKADIAAMNMPEPESQALPAGTWGFLTNHAHVLLCISRDPRSRARDIAEQVGITERATQRILAELIGEGYVTRTKAGRRNHYEINPRGHLRHPVLRDLSIEPLMEALNRDG